MRVPLQLHKRPTSEPATALLVTSREAADVLAVCARLSLDPRGRVFDLPDSLLLLLAGPTCEVFPYTIRLRGLARNLFVPADADLVPALLDDEARGLVRDRGLVFLPGERVLGYAPDQPLPLSALLAGSPLQRRAWQPLPERLPLASRLQELLLDIPHVSPDRILEAGGEGIGTEEPQPEDTGPASRALGQARLAFGRSLVWLGEKLGSKGLAGLGAKWVQRALVAAPRLSESLLGRQEAALRELLREFREGSLEKALRRALPLGDPAERGGVAARDARLPQHNLIYSLGNILGNRGGPASIWIGGYDVQAELAREYRKAAEQAAQRGDHRRAAFIYGRLLHDYRMAANTLSQGGLYHDAAILYLEKLDDKLAAARAFEAAGEFDRAVQLYRLMREHVRAGDLLRRAGEEEAALAEYYLAADQLIEAGHGHHAAGDLILTRAGRPDLALPYFQTGWNLRREGVAVPCALRLAELYSQQETPNRLLDLVAEAEDYFRPPGRDVTAGQFFNALARLAEEKTLAPVREELRDRALLGLALKLRQRAQTDARPGDLVSTLLGGSSTWSAPLVHDAQFALQAGRKQPRPVPSAVIAPQTSRRIRVGEGVVTAACHAPASGDVFVGFQDGTVMCFRPLWGQVVKLPGHSTLPVSSLATDALGQFVVVLRNAGHNPRYLASFVRRPQGEYEYAEARPLEHEAAWQPFLAPFIEKCGPAGYLTGLWGETGMQLLHGEHLTPRTDWEPQYHPAEVIAALLALPFDPATARTAFFLLGSGSVWYCPRQGLVSDPVSLGWRPTLAPSNSLLTMPLAWWQADLHSLELAGIGEFGNLYWSAIEIHGNHLVIRRTNARAADRGHLAAGILRSGLVAGIHGGGIDWLRSSATSGFSLVAREAMVLDSPVACFPSPTTCELIVVLGDGHVVPVTVPS
jgi:hypothetical protein